MSKRQVEYYAGDLFGEIYHDEATGALVQRPSARDYLPGFAVAVTASLAAGWLADHYDFPLILLGLLIGLALSFLAEDARTAPGLDWISRHCLRLGIVLLGLQITFSDMAALGWVAFGGLLLVMGASYAAAMLGARLFAQQSEAGILAGGATAICGASAALALYGIIGRDRLDQARFSVTLVAISLASAIAMAAYPVIAASAGFSDSQAGFLIGASVHDAAQAIGGGYSYSDAAGEDATIVKLARVALLAPIVALVALWIGRTGRSQEQAQGTRWAALAVPWFIIAFFAVVALNSLAGLPVELTARGLDVSKALLLVAVTATAIRSRLGLLLEVGWRAMMPVAFATLASAGAAFAIAWALLP